MHALVLALAILADDPGFGGAAGAPADDGEACVVKGDDGVWRACADVLAQKKAPADDGPPPDDPETAAMKKHMREVEAAQQKAVEAPLEKTKMEIDLEKAHLDPTMPLLAVRVAAARAQAVLDKLEKNGASGPAHDAALADLAEAEAVRDTIERIAAHRMDLCTNRHGKKSTFKNYRMTPAGPVMLTTAELMASLPLVDPAGCERITLVDDKVVARVKRAREIRRILPTKETWQTLDERKVLEKELKDLETELGKDAIPALSAPGMPDPYR